MVDNPAAEDAARAQSRHRGGLARHRRPGRRARRAHRRLHRAGGRAAGRDRRRQRRRRDGRAGRDAVRAGRRLRRTQPKLGLGGSAFHLASSPAGQVETVFLGVFRKEALQAVGGFDETMQRAQDWELNYRLRGSGRTIWFSPELRVTYRPRSTVRDSGQADVRDRQVAPRGDGALSAKRPRRAISPRRWRWPPSVPAPLLGLIGLALGVRPLLAGFLAPAGYLVLVVAGAVTARAACRWPPGSGCRRCWPPPTLLGGRVPGRSAGPEPGFDIMS